MTHILFLILKILGIILLILLGLICLAVLTVLFVPVRYRLWGEWRERQFITGRVSWLFRFCVFHFSYVRLPQEQEGISWKITVLGKKVREGCGQEGEKDDGAGKPEVSACPKEPDAEASQGVQSARAVPPGPSPQEPLLEDEKRFQGAIKKESSGEKREKQKGERLKKLRFSFRAICDKLKNIKDSAALKWEWLQEEKNQAALRFLWKQFGRLCRHLCPGKGMVSVTFGFEDPYTTGQVLEAASLAYPFFHSHLSLYPVFDGAVLEAEGNVRGRIRLSFLLWLVLQVLFDGHTRRMLLSLWKNSLN